MLKNAYRIVGRSSNRIEMSRIALIVVRFLLIQDQGGLSIESIGTFESILLFHSGYVAVFYFIRQRQC